MEIMKKDDIEEEFLPEIQDILELLRQYKVIG